MNSVFKHQSFRGSQEKIIQQTLLGKNSLIIMPTGMGKSLCYQMPALAGGGLVLVISPLIALMEDQVSKARRIGLRATAIHSAVRSTERQERMHRLSQGHWQLLYVTPERFKKPEFLEVLDKFLQQGKIQLLAVDEAHCISQWGHDFRPDYSRLGEFRKGLKSPPLMALTATATLQVQKDIMEQLLIDGSSWEIFSEGIERPNIALHVQEVYGFDEKIRHIVALRHQYPGPAIFYFTLIKTLQKVSSQLERLSIPHFIYHGNLPADIRRQQQRGFLENTNSPLILATPAFGLGVDKPDIRLIAHGEIPGSVESYFQEVGRAGRDGKIAHCYLLFDQDDVNIQMDFIKWSNPDIQFICAVYGLIKNNFLRVKQEGMNFLSEKMNFYNRRDFRVETAVNILERWGCLVEGKNSRFPYDMGEDLPEEVIGSEAEIRNKRRLRTQNEKLLEMVRLVATKTCRMVFILEYFGYKTAPPCGICDICKKV